LKKIDKLVFADSWSLKTTTYITYRDMYAVSLYLRGFIYTNSYSCSTNW